MKQKLNETEKKVLDCIKEYHKKNKIMPTNREIGEGCGMARANVYSYLMKLQAKGHIKLGLRNRARDIVLKK